MPKAVWGYGEPLALPGELGCSLCGRRLQGNGLEVAIGDPEVMRGFCDLCALAIAEVLFNRRSVTVTLENGSVVLEVL